jgi:hypothetical protein
MEASRQRATTIQIYDNSEIEIWLLAFIQIILKILQSLFNVFYVIHSIEFSISG